MDKIIIIMPLSKTIKVLFCQEKSKYAYDLWVILIKNNLLNSYLGTNDSSNIAKGFTKILVCLVILFLTLIVTSLSSDAKKYFKKYVFENTFEFDKFNNWYTSLAGGFSFGKTEVPVFGESIKYQKIEKHLEGDKLIISDDTVINALTGGVVVFIGEKEGYNETVIIQCNNGYDIWYGNLESTNVQMYDYISEGSLIGSASSEVYLLITKDGQKVSYEEYETKI